MVMYDPRVYLLSMCCCKERVRVREYGRAPDRCANCGGWIPPSQEDAAEYVARDWRRAAIWWGVLVGIVGMAIASVVWR